MKLHSNKNHPAHEQALVALNLALDAVERLAGAHDDEGEECELCERWNICHDAEGIAYMVRFGIDVLSGTVFPLSEETRAALREQRDRGVNMRISDVQIAEDDEELAEINAEMARPSVPVNVTVAAAPQTKPARRFYWQPAD